jgi:coproporphyrinogen III oxidase-like Fe-S oxidoreductase
VEKETLSPVIRAWERIMLGFRTKEGILKSELERYARQQGVSYEERFGLFKKEGFLSFREGRVAVTPKGYFVLNGLLETLVP